MITVRIGDVTLDSGVTGSDVSLLNDVISELVLLLLKHDNNVQISPLCRYSLEGSLII